MPFTPGVSGNSEKKWRPGQSGNPAGLRKGSKHLATYIKEMMVDEKFTVEYVEGYTLKKHKGAPVKALVKVAMLKSLAGDKGWAEWLAKYGYGAKSEIDITSNGETVTSNLDTDTLTQFMMMAKNDTKK